MNDLVLLRLTEVLRKRKLGEIREAFQVDSQRLNGGLSLMKGLEKVLGYGGGVRVRLVRIANRGARLTAFGGRDKGFTKRHLGEHKGKSMMKGCKTCYVD